MAQKYSTAYNFNYFAVDFNEEIGALFGPLLDRQTEFVEQSIKKILSLYQNEPNNPKSVILVGHSTVRIVLRTEVLWFRNFYLHKFYDYFYEVRYSNSNYSMFIFMKLGIEIQAIHQRGKGYR